ncbi:hypothetical protein B7G54_06240 [Burkholderia puraquae]|uniref:Uncharacterized protein n=1 Tax=Burkholderia puraquae TaxID=1904757 RepID=A0A1X1PMG7_9BURK|nr:hypothetical protein [Burkholderia puraquae]ORT88200.1 hypothetical protein B7G54_06240 [Burkholderia puraquae]CAB3750463.1 hypothetical protein LMG29660_01291 [Burkholderia puraquae]
MHTTVLLRTTHSHLYPGSVVTLDNDAPRAMKPHPAVIEFVGFGGCRQYLQFRSREYRAPASTWTGRDNSMRGATCDTIHRDFH